MPSPSVDAGEQLDAFEAVRTLLQRHVACDELTIPLLPEVAVRVVGSGTRKSADARLLANIIHADAALTMYVLRIAASAAKRPVAPIASLQHAVAWLGMDEVSNIAFTLALQGKLLDVKGQHRKARRLWRHSLASALWSRQLAHMLARETGVCYLSGLLHGIGNIVTLGAVNEMARGAGVKLASEDYDRLIGMFGDAVGEQVLGSWRLPDPIPRVIAHWREYAKAADVQWEANILNMAHKLADFTLHEVGMLKRDALIGEAAYADLGFTTADAARLFDSAASIDAELDHYLSP